MNELSVAADSADLPAVYTQAVRALSECEALDECRDWTNKAQALASYARQSRDNRLYKMAVRIQARAYRRCGELLEQVEPQQGANQNIQEATLPKVGRTQAAADAGLSEHQRKTALRVASVPEDQFNDAVEGVDPPNVGQLAAVGTQKKPGAPSPNHGPLDDRALELRQTLRRFAEFCQENPAEQMADSFRRGGLKPVKEDAEAISGWLNEFVGHATALKIVQSSRG